MRDLLDFTDYFTAPEDDDTMEVTSCSVARMTAELPDHLRSDSTALSEHTTFRLGWPSRKLVRATTDAEVVEAVREPDAAGEPLLCGRRLEPAGQ